MDARTQNVFDALNAELASLGLKKVGKLKNRLTREIDSSRISIGMECLDRELWNPEPAYPALAELGAKRARLQSGWALTEKVKGEYDFAWLDKVVDRLISLGIEPWLCICYGNPLYAAPGQKLRAGGMGHAPADSEESMEAWLAYVDKLVSHFSGRVAYYEIWNEPDCKHFLPYGERWAEKYSEMVAAVSPVIRRADPKAKIAGGSFCMPETCRVDALLSLGMAKHVDILSYHDYKELPEKSAAWNRRPLQSLVREKAPGLRLWMSEGGVTSYTPAASFGALHEMSVSEDVQARWVARKTILDLANETLDLVAYFHLYDFLHFTKTHNYYYGILREGDYSKKPSFYALRNVCSLFDWRVFPTDGIQIDIHKTKRSERLKDSFLMNCVKLAFNVRGGSPLLAIWHPSETNQPFEASAVKLNYWLPGGKLFKRPVAVNMITGDAFDPSQGADLEIPLCNYPFIVGDMDSLQIAE